MKSNYFQWGKIKPTVSTSVPHRIIFFDTETVERSATKRSVEQHLLLGWAVYWQAARSRSPERIEWFFFRTTAEFWTWVLAHVKPKNPLCLVSHNIGFDLQVLGALQELPARGWKLTRLYDKGMMFLLQVTEPTVALRDHLDAGLAWADFEGPRWRRKIRCSDNCNLFPGSLQQLGESIGSEKLAMPATGAGEDAWSVYCKQDVNVMLLAWKRRRAFILDNDLGAMKLTIASQALTTFRHRFMPHAIKRHRDPVALRLEREAYRGGRSEAFYLGTIPDPPIYRLDVNSLYPYVMLMRTFPYQVAAVLDNVTIKHLQRLMERYCVIADVTLDCAEPVFPLRTPDRNFYPIGWRRQVLTGPEIAYALERGWALAVHQVAIYERADLFSEFITYFYDRKLAAKDRGDLIEYRANKGMMNSLAGKFGQRGREDQVIGTCDPAMLRLEQGWNQDQQCSYTVTYVGGLVTESYERGEGTFSVPAIAAHINAEARIYMWRMMQIAGFDNVFYMDTDSLFVNQTGYDRLSWKIDPDRIGSLKVEAIGQEVIIRGPKDYEWDGKITLKGIPRTAEKIDTSTYNVMEWPSFSAHIAAGKPIGYVNKKFIKRLRRRTEWGQETESGWVLPFVLVEGGSDYNRADLLTAIPEIIGDYPACWEICGGVKYRHLCRNWACEAEGGPVREVEPSGLALADLTY